VVVAEMRLSASMLVASMPCCVTMLSEQRVCLLSVWRLLWVWTEYALLAVVILYVGWCGRRREGV
jgi:hypothetical protein